MVLDSTEAIIDFLSNEQWHQVPSSFSGLYPDCRDIMKGTSSDLMTEAI